MMMMVHRLYLNTLCTLSLPLMMTTKMMHPMSTNWIEIMYFHQSGSQRCQNAKMT